MKISNLLIGIVTLTVVACSTKKNTANSSANKENYETHLAAIKNRYTDAL